MVGVPGFEPGASWSRTKHATICATPRSRLRISKAPVYSTIAFEKSKIFYGKIGTKTGKMKVFTVLFPVCTGCTSAEIVPQGVFFVDQLYPVDGIIPVIRKVDSRRGKTYNITKC